jgi:hypothetical protein
LRQKIIWQGKAPVVTAFTFPFFISRRICVVY